MTRGTRQGRAAATVPHPHRRPSLGLALVLALTALATVALTWRPPVVPPSGLAARYFANPSWNGTPLLTTIDREASSDTIASHPELRAHPAFSVEWSGTLLVGHAGLHRFATKSDDGSWLWIDEQLVVDNGGPHPVRNVSADVPLTRGAHAFRLRYVQYGGDAFLQVGQAGVGGVTAPPAPLVAEPISYAAFRWAQLWPLALVASWYLAVLCVAGRSALRLRLVEQRDALTVVTICLALAAAHIGYGLPPLGPFVADELEPVPTLVASTHGFTDWNLRWPAFHPRVLALALQPFVWASGRWQLPLADTTVVAAMYLVVRAVSLGLLGLTLWLTWDMGRRLFDRRSGLYAAVLLGLSPVVLYFGPFSNLEMAHLFWTTLSFWAGVRALHTPTLGWFAAVGAAVGLALAAKDQTYGFYVAAPVAAYLVLLRSTSERRAGGRWLAPLVDRRLLTLGAATILAFALGHETPWQWDRFAAHVRFIVGGAASPFQMFPRTASGHLDLLRTTALSFVWAAGWPLALAAMAGAAWLSMRGRVGTVVAVATPMVTYLVTFLAVVLYVYDRFLIAWLPLVALVAGHAMATLDRWGMPARAAAACRLVVIGAAVANGVAQNVVFAGDPRYRAADWLSAHVACGTSVGVTYNTTYMPPLPCYDVWLLRASLIDGMTAWPEYLVFNDAYVQRFEATPSGHGFMVRLRAGDLPFERVFRAETRPPVWAPLYWEGRFWNEMEDAETTADKPLHAIEVWRRRDVRATD